MSLFIASIKVQIKSSTTFLLCQQEPLLNVFSYVSSILIKLLLFYQLFSLLYYICTHKSNTCFKYSIFWQTFIIPFLRFIYHSYRCSNSGVAAHVTPYLIFKINHGYNLKIHSPSLKPFE